MTKKLTETMTVDHPADPGAALAQRRAELIRRRAGAIQTRDTMRPGGTADPLPLRISYLQVLEEIEQLDAELADIGREQEALRRAGVERTLASRAPGQRALDEALVPALEDLRGRLAERVRYAEETGILVGHPPASCAAALLLLHVDAALAQVRREVDDPRPPAPPAPPAPGLRRVRVLIHSLLDRTNGVGHWHSEGDVCDLDEAEVRRLSRTTPPAVELVEVPVA